MARGCDTRRTGSSRPRRRPAGRAARAVRRVSSTPQATPSVSTASAAWRRPGTAPRRGSRRRPVALMTTRARRRPLASAARAAMAAGSSAGGALVTTARRAAPAEAGLQLGEALPQVPAAEAVRREEEEQNRGGGLHHVDAHGTAVGRDADDVARGVVVGGPAVVGMGRSRRRMSAGGSVTGPSTARPAPRAPRR